ncbi:hypothetical protein ABH931_000504 [Streptacidiphilus sp. MAP12-33]|uniref:N-6 DNA methylase n=1 Tax=Streptacidiphilus sp. MAP12-33 TaxID=3156266 RepID=UPI003512C1A4
MAQQPKARKPHEQDLNRPEREDRSDRSERANRSDRSDRADRSAVTATAIARLAGVGPAAVSNWRRRHADFPKPVGGTSGSPTFDLAEVETWLRAQGKLTQVPLRERAWQQVEQYPIGPSAALIRLGAALTLGPDPGAADTPMLTTGLQLAAELGPAAAFAFLLGRQLDSVSRQHALTPPEPAALMAELGGPAADVLDPACGFGGLLDAARALHPDARLCGQDADPELAALAELRLTLAAEGAASGADPGGGVGGPRPGWVEVRTGDALRADAFDRPPHAPGADVVLCHPPFNERNWGHEELAYDSRWEYGLPPRTESELAWVQHALAHAREGGTAVVLMPPAAASRRSGRRIRADLLRRGALRAVIALPVGAAPPYGIPLHLWVLRRPSLAPAPVAATTQGLLLVETGGLPWPEARAAALEAWRGVDAGESGSGTAAERPGVSRVVAVVDLLDDEVDLTPARHLPPAAVAGGALGLDEVREQLADALRRASRLPATGEAVEAAAGAAGTARPGGGWPATSVGELARAGALTLLTPAGGDEAPRTRAGDVVVTVLGQEGGGVHVVTEDAAGAPLERGQQLLRPDPDVVDPWFLAGFLRSTANSRQASTFTSTSTRLDARRLQLPRLPLTEQRRYGERFRAVAEFEQALRQAARLGEQFAQGLYDGLADGGPAGRP